MPWTEKILTFFQDHSGNQSWARFCAFVALVIAVIREFQGADVAHVALWLGVATGNYVASKVTEMVTASKTVTVEPKEK